MNLNASYLHAKYKYDERLKIVHANLVGKMNGMKLG
jgi:hypothetical protein